MNIKLHGNKSDLDYTFGNNSASWDDPNVPISHAMIEDAFKWLNGNSISTHHQRVSITIFRKQGQTVASPKSDEQSFDSRKLISCTSYSWRKAKS